MSDQDAFRAEVRAWLEANCPPEMREPVRDEGDVCWGGRKWVFKNDAQKQWLEACAAKGYTVPDWPKEYGGAGLTPEQTKILKQEMKRINARSPLDSFGIWMLGPALLKFGTEEQKVHYLNQIARGEIRWCQGYSEPGSGSDLVSLQTFGEDKGRSLGRQRIEDLDQLCRQGRLDLLPRPHRQGEQISGHHLHALRHGEQGRHDQADPADFGQFALLRNLLRRCRSAQGRSSSVRSTRGWDVAKYLLGHEREMISGGGAGGDMVSIGGAFAKAIGKNDHGELGRSDPARRNGGV